MVSTTQLRQIAPRVVSLQQKIQRQRQKQVTYEVPKPQEQVRVEQNLEALREQEAKQKEYEKAVQEYNEWKQAERMFLEKKRYDPKSSVGRKIDRLYRNQEMALEDAEYYRKKAMEVQKPTYIEGGMSIAPELVEKPKTAEEIFGSPTASMDIFRTGKEQIKQPTQIKPTIYSETKRYEELGYTQREAKRLAEKSVKEGGVSALREPTFLEKVSEGRTRKTWKMSPLEYKQYRESQQRQTSSILGSGKKELPYGFESATRFIKGDKETIQKTISGEEKSILTPLFWTSGKIAETKPVSMFFSGIEEKYPTQYAFAEEKVSPILASVTGGVVIGGFFSPAMETGTAGQIQKQLSKTKFEKLTGKLAKLEKEVAKKKTTTEQLKYLKEIKAKLKTPEEIKNFQKWARGLVEKDIVKVPTQPPTEVQKIIVDLQIDIPSTMKGAGVLTSEQNLFIKKEVPVQKKATIQETKFNVLSVGKTSQIPKLSTGILAGFKLMEKPKQLLGEKTKQATKQREGLKQKEILKQLKKSVLLQKTAQKLKEGEMFRQFFKQKGMPKQKTTPIKKRIPISKPLLQRLSKRVEDGKLFEAIGFRFGKEVRLGKAGTKKGAEKELEKFLKGTLGASGFLEKEGVKLRAEELGLLKQPTFRKSKVSPFLIVERKEKRLRKGGTGKEIQFFRKKGSKKSSLL